jgi:pimeloyl-ACP methyl ester carboxylesterase
VNDDRGQFVLANGVTLYVEDEGAGAPVLLVHGWPDSARLWRYQIPFLTGHGFRTIAPDLRGFGRSERPYPVAAYALRNAVADLVALLDTKGIGRAHVVGHDWGAAVAWLLAILHPDRVERLVVLSVPHPRAPQTMRQREMAWYQLFFQFEGVAEATIVHDDWRFFRELTRGEGDVEQHIEDLARPGALTASLGWYRANLAPREPGAMAKLAPVKVPTLGIWSTRDHYLDGARMKASGAFVQAQWRYVQIEDASHWLQLDAPNELNQLLLDWLR